MSFVAVVRVDRMFTVAARHRHRKMPLLIYRAQKEHKTNIIEL